jgi:triosephosphate isomerase
MQRRKKLIAANWKMYKTPAEAQAFFPAFLPLVSNPDRDDIVVCPPFVCIAAAVEAARQGRVGIGGQDLFWEKEGAYTGEISAGMLVGAGCTHVIIGHSERRQYFGETDDTVNHKLHCALEAGLVPIVCVGEVLEEREAGLTKEILRRQCVGAWRKLPSDRAAHMAMAYEPVWAIGTGMTATPQMASEAHLIIRDEASEQLGKEVAQGLRILYGGSVKPENAGALMAEEEIDGALVGGASLKPESFAGIVNYQPAPGAKRGE